MSSHKCTKSSPKVPLTTPRNRMTFSAPPERTLLPYQKGTDPRVNPAQEHHAHVGDNLAQREGRSFPSDLTGGEVALLWQAMRCDEAFDLSRSHRFFEIIHSAKLHGFEIAFHLQATG